MHRFHESNRCMTNVGSSRVDRVYPAVELRTVQRCCQLSGTSTWWCRSRSALLAPTWVSPDFGSVHTWRPAARIMNPISAAGGGTDVPAPSASSGVSSADPATISSSSLACEAGYWVQPCTLCWCGDFTLVCLFVCLFILRTQYDHHRITGRSLL